MLSNPESRIPNPGLQAWLDYQQRVHPQSIALGLDRVREVWNRLGAPRPAPIAIAVGGTNGKGSTVAFLEAMLRADGKRVGAYTSPHLLAYNERVRVDGIDADDARLVAAFERIEAARGEIALTYFEYGTLAALLVFAEAALDVAVLEVGLGGRLDAVNLIDADAAIVTTIDLDHQDWLGGDRDSIGREKAGIFRAGRPAIVGEPAPPDGLLDEARRIGADLRIAGRAFRVEIRDRDWIWIADDARCVLPHPALAAACQHANAAAAIAALHAVRARTGWNPEAIARGVASARIAARIERFAGAPELIVDVAHNPQAARVLAGWLGTHPSQGRTIAVFGALADKDVPAIVAAMKDVVDAWVIAGLARESSRGLAADSLSDRLRGTAARAEIASRHDDVAPALDAAFALADERDRVVAFGSFFVAAAALRFAAARVREPLTRSGADSRV
ncbi:MAG TPA: bifunctional tetrahydrofolate synthase/dihydrofolate synthase [Rhodanobacteraceae bacterium]|nr:bifunctional tetrahydrofolate synthase/dihydrofolate synthase [Rhodanobacteraceae bacterium]